MKILLIDIDSKIPNLALMKLSAWHKKQGDIVEFNNYLCNPDRVYVSCVFSQNAIKVKQLPFENIVAGGSGLGNWDVVLSDEIEHIMPDYGLYSNVDYSLGFTTRGCFRKCPFCIVPEKEGNIHFNADIYEFWNRKHKKIVLLDNNIFACEGTFERISGQIIKEKLKVDFNQGLDIRLLTEEKARILKELRPLKQWRFAFDSVKYEDKFREGAEMLLKAGISKSKICIYVLAGFDEPFESSLYRVMVVYKEYGFDPFVMLYQGIASEHSQLKKWGKDFKDLKNMTNLPSWKKYKEFSRWVACKQMFKTKSFDEWCKIRNVRNLEVEG